MLEKGIEQRVVDYAKKKGCFVRKFTSPGHRSAPDRIFAYKGQVFWIELKKTGEKPTTLQLLEHREMRKHGLRVYVADSVTKGKAIIDAEIDRVESL